MLEHARRLGFIGPGPLAIHLDHADGFAEAIGTGWPAELDLRSAVDLGSGGGVPGLSLALRFPHAQWALVEAARRRIEFLRDAVISLSLSDRVRVVADRAEEIGRLTEYRGQTELVVARGFGPPAVVAECAAPVLRVGGIAVISEPPGGAPRRWSADGLAMLGMAVGPAVQAIGMSFQVLVQVNACPVRFPRRVGVPAKRPLF